MDGNGTDGQDCGTARVRDAARTRQRLLEAAFDLFSQRPYSSVGTREIAAHAGVNITLISRYFGSKKGLFREVLERLGPAREQEALAGADRETVRGRTLAAVGHLLDPGENRLKRERRLVMLSMMEPEVADLIPPAIAAHYDRSLSGMPGGDRQTRTLLVASLVTGIGMAMHFFQDRDLTAVDRGAVLRFVEDAFDRLWEGGAEESPDSAPDNAPDRAPDGQPAGKPDELSAEPAAEEDLSAPEESGEEPRAAEGR